MVPGQQRRRWAEAGQPCLGPDLPPSAEASKDPPPSAVPKLGTLLHNLTSPGLATSHSPRQGCARPCSPQPTPIRALFFCFTLPRTPVPLEVSKMPEGRGDLEAESLPPKWGWGFHPLPTPPRPFPSTQSPHPASSPLLTPPPPVPAARLMLGVKGRQSPGPAVQVEG